MDRDFLSAEEKDYLISNGQYLKILSRIEKEAQAIKKALGHQDGPTKVFRGTQVDVSFGLDDLTPERFEEIIPDIKKHLKEYHDLRGCQQVTEKELSRLNNFGIFEVTLKEK